MLPTLLALCLSGSEQPVLERVETAVEVELSAVETAMLNELNAFRARFGLRPLIVSPALQASARRHSDWMAKNRSMTHGNSGVAENIAAGQRSAKEVTATWANSPAHALGMRTNHVHVGLAHTNGFWVQQFGTIRSNKPDKGDGGTTTAPASSLKIPAATPIYVSPPIQYPSTAACYRWRVFRSRR